MCGEEAEAEGCALTFPKSAHLPGDRLKPEPGQPAPRLSSDHTARGADGVLSEYPLKEEMSEASLRALSIRAHFSEFSFSES